ncbi:hypothetical protein K7H20_24150 [Salipiger manganoxidans]|uniref:hypothetical protein n=1 Tax=Salipiger marinus TaxID=555512 RepID=UPI001E5EC0EE|nr:hypothetical protein [Salipiger manganoxidans]MCD1621134.1 hypothetical protein [Salipiger manganoxidans]
MEPITETSVKLEAQIHALKMLVAIMASRMAKDFTDPDEFILHLTAPLRATSDMSDSGEPLLRVYREAMNDIADYVEDLALGT